MASRSLGTLTVDLVAKIGGFTAGMSKAERETQRSTRAMERRLKETTAAAKKFGVALGAAFVAAGTAAAVAIKSAIDNADELSKSAQKIGVTTEALSALAYAAQLADVDLGTLQGGLARLTKFQNDAAMGTEKNIALFDALGISFKNADGTLRNTEEVFRDFAKVFQALPDGANKTALALDVFGRSGANLIPLLNGGADGLDAMREKAESLGIVIDTQTGKAAEEFNDRLADLQLAASGLATAVAAELLPDLNRLTDELQAGTASGDGFAATAENVANGIRGVAWVAGKAYDTIKLLALGIANVVAELAKFSATYAPIALFVSDDTRAMLADVASVTESGAREAAQSLTGDGPAGVNRPGGQIVFEDPPAAKASAKAAEDVTAALIKYQGSAGAAAQATAGLAAAREAERAAAKAQADADKASQEARAEAYDEVQRVYKDELKAIADEAEARKKAKEIVDQTLADIAFETQLMGLNNLEREKAIALRYANVDAASAEGQAIGAALDELDRARDVAEGMDVVRGATEGLFSDLMDGSKSAKDAFKDFVDGILEGIAQIVARNLTESLFGSFGSTGGGAGGGFLTSLFGSLFGGGRAAGGPVSGNRIYEVGEGNRPELLNSAGRTYLIPGNNGQVTPMGAGRGGSTTINFVLPGRNDIRTEAQRQSDLARTTQRQLQRGTA